MASFVSKNNIIDLRKQDGVFEGNVDDYDATYKLVKIVLKIVGLRVTINDKKWTGFGWHIYFWYMFLNITLGCALEVILMIQTARHGTFLDLFRMMPCVGYLLVAMAKSSKIKIYRPIFENLISELREMWPNGRVDQEEHKTLSEALSGLKFHLRAYFSCNFILGSIFIVPVLIAYIRHRMGHDIPLLLPFALWLPFDPYQDVVYEVVMLSQTYQCFISVFFMLSGDLLFIIYVSHITTQFSLLTVRLNNLLPASIDDQLIKEYPLGAYSKKNEKPNRNTSENVGAENTSERELGLIFQRHLALIRLSDDVEKMYTFSFLVNFMNSSVIICFSLFCVVFVEKWNELNYKVFFVMAVSQTWIVCLYGQRLLDTSTGVAEALYNSGWYSASSKIKKSILIMIHRSQKAVRVTTYGFSIISLESYATILKTSWSYFTLMINMYQDQ